MNTEKLEKLKKSLDNKFIPDNVKDKIRNEIKNLESEIKSEDITATELKKEVAKVEVAVEKAEKKAESTEPKKGRGRPRKTPATTPAEPKATETAIKKTAMSVAKTIRKDGEKWNDAMKRANGVMKKEKVEVKKTTKSELDRLLARVRKNKSLMSELKGVKDLGRDAMRTAKPVGKRMSESGNVYYEYRANKTDRKTYGKYAFAGGGRIESLTKELKRLQRDLNSSRLNTYKLGDVSQEEIDRKKEREVKLARFDEILKVLRESDAKFELGGSVVTDFAGHTGGSFGTGNQGVLDGFSNTAYTGLVGETGAMSSGEMFMNGGGLPAGAEQSYVNYYLGEGASAGIFKDGGGIPNNYEGKSPKEVWELLTLKQKEHFLLDHFNHFDVDDFKGKNLTELAKMDYKNIPVLVRKEFIHHIEMGQYAKGGGVRKVGNREYSYGRNWTNDHRHTNKGEEHEVKYTRKGKFLGVFDDGGNVDSTKQQLQKGDDVLIIGRRWFDRVNGNTYHTAEVQVNGEFIGKSKMTYGYEEQYLETGKEILLDHFELPEGMKETDPLWRLREYDVILHKYAIDGLKRELADGGFMDGVYAKGGGVRQVGNREYSLGRNWTNDHRHTNKSEEHEVNYNRKRFFAGGGSVNDDTPKIYVADLEAYNNGRLSGVWLDLTDYSDADELMDAINDFLKTTGGEEYAIHDYENLPRSMYSEYMGARDFAELYEMMDLAKEKDLPLDVVMEIVSQFDRSALDEYTGVYDSEQDFAEQLVDDLGGIQNFNDFEYYLEISDTDRRLLSQEMADNYVDDIRDEDGGNRLIEEAGLDVDEYEEADSDRQEEMLDEAREMVYDEYYNTWYDGLSDPYYFLVEEQGLYDAESFANANFVRVDYEKLADALEQDYTFIRHDGQIYVFNIR